VSNGRCALLDDATLFELGFDIIDLYKAVCSTYGTNCAIIVERHTGNCLASLTELCLGEWLKSLVDNQDVAVLHTDGEVFTIVGVTGAVGTAFKLGILSLSVLLDVPDSKHTILPNCYEFLLDGVDLKAPDLLVVV